MIHAFDMRTLVLIYVCICIGQAVILVYLWSVQRNYPPAKDWAIGALLSAVGLFLLALRDIAPMWISELLANAFMLPGWMVFNYGIVKAAGKKPSVRLGLILCTIVIGLLAWHSFVSPNRSARIIENHLTLVSFYACAIYACLTAPKCIRTITFRLIATLLLLLSLTCLWRIANDAFGMTWLFPHIPSRIIMVGASTVIFPMTTMLLALQTSQRLQEEINDQAGRDMLTGVFNRRAFDEIVNREWSRSLRHDYPLSFLMVDVDHFKTFNDQHGHHVGDAALVQVSNAAQTALRINDIWCRYGGEEFVVLLPNTTIEQAMTVAERLRVSVGKATVATQNELLNVSVSIGVAERSPGQSHWEEVLANSDAALYLAKAAGRNRVVADAST